MLTLPRQDSDGGTSSVDVAAAVAAVAYIAEKLPGADLHKVSKVLYFADKLHLGRFGRTIAGDRYIAMQYGPVPSNVYDALKALRGKQIPSELSSRLGSHVRVNGRRVESIAPADLEWLSDSDVEALDEAVALCLGQDFGDLTYMSHDAAWTSTPRNGEMSLESIVKTLDNSETVLEHLRGDFDE